MARQRKTKDVDTPRINTSERKRGDIDVRLNFPIMIGSHRDQARHAVLEITDGPSRQEILEVDIPADALLELLAGGTVHLSGATMAARADLLGKRSQNTSTAIHSAYGVDVDAVAEATKADYLANGWEEVSIRRMNYGRLVVAYRWLAIED